MAALARLLLLLVAAIALLSGVFLALSWTAPIPEAWGFRGANAVLGVVIGSVGYLVATRRSRNRVGWLLLLVGLLNAIDGLATDYAAFALFGGGGASGGAVGAWVHDWIWILYIALFASLFLYFPDGRLPSSRWRAVLWISIGSSAVCLSLLAFLPGPLATFGVANPFGLAILEPFDAGGTKTGGFVGIFLGVLSLTLLASGASPFMRYARANGDTRQQIKWFAAAAVLSGVIFTGSTPFAAHEIAQAAVLVGFLTVPIAIGIAILRHRLYEIDAIINVTLVYAALTALLAGVFAASQEILKRLFVAVTGQGSDAIVVVALFIIATLFAPARARLQKIVDTRFRPAQFVEPNEAAPRPVEALRELATLHAEGVITDAEFAAKKAELLARI